MGIKRVTNRAKLEIDNITKRVEDLEEEVKKIRREYGKAKSRNI